MAARSVHAFSPNRKNTPSPASPAAPSVGTTSATITLDHDQVWLSSLNQHPVFGIESETPERQQFLKEKALSFAAAVRSDSLEQMEPCHVEDPFCSLRKDYPSLSENPKHVRNPSPRRAGIAAARRALLSSNVKALAKQSPRDVEEAIREIPSLKPLEKLAAQLLASTGCLLPNVSLNLAEKSEESLPNEASRQKALQLYELASRCNTGDAKYSAQYRYSMLQVWADRCDLATPFLSEIVASGQLNYLSRALFWQVKCSERIGTQDSLKMGEQARVELLTQFPFSLQALLLRHADPHQLKSLLTVQDSPARFRSVQRPFLNTMVTAAEALIKIGELGIAKKILASINADADSAEPEFQIYLAWLYHNVGDSVSKFRTLTVAFRDHPNVISREALEFYYPLKGRANGHD